MTENQRIWAQSRNELVQAVTLLGFPAELAELMAMELKSPKAIGRPGREASDAAFTG